MSPKSPVGVVVIGRNEGARLDRCLRSALAASDSVVYVDSGSHDGSVALARSLDVDVVELDASRPFSAARARNEGFARLGQIDPGASLVQFVDGDCELIEGWLKLGETSLVENEALSIVAGQVRERHPDDSRYNRLCAMEWRSAAGETDSVGGISMVRRAAFAEVEGFDPRIIAGEEPELCYRLRRQGWKILRLDADMVWHDAEMLRFGQWWRRQLRAGHSCAENYWLHGRRDFAHYGRVVTSNLVYGLAVPLLAFAGAWATSGVSLLLFFAYARLYGKVRAERIRLGDSPGSAGMYARYTVLGKFAQTAGILTYLVRRVLGRRRRLIEYKDPG